MTRGDIAEKLGLPVAAVVGFIHSYADGAHTSIPAPGLGAWLPASVQGLQARAPTWLSFGVSADDIAVVSKHDTSTNANDPNESELHNTLAHAIGRTDGNPLFVISQKTLTGHAKGGACIFQVNGLTQLFKSGVIPANAALDCVDPKLQRDDHMVWVRKPLRIGGGEDEFGRETLVARSRPVWPPRSASDMFPASWLWSIRVPSRRPWPRPMVRPHWKLGVSVPRPPGCGQRHLEEGMMVAPRSTSRSTTVASARITVATTTTRSKRRCSSTRTPASVPTATTRPDSSGSPRLMGASSAPDLGSPL